jgi:hypothetical protein
VGKAGVHDLTAAEKVYRQLACKDGVLKTRVIIDVIPGPRRAHQRHLSRQGVASDLSMDKIVEL